MEFDIDASFRIKKKIKSIQDLVEVITFLEEVKNYAKVSDACKIANYMQDEIKMPLDLVKIILLYITFNTTDDVGETVTYVDLFSEHLPQIYRDKFSHDPLRGRWHYENGLL